MFLMMLITCVIHYKNEGENKLICEYKNFKLNKKQERGERDSIVCRHGAHDQPKFDPQHTK